MSRTKKKQKSPGYEYWSKRLGNKNGQSPGRIAKNITNSKERMEEKQLISRIKKEN